MPNLTWPQAVVVLGAVGLGFAAHVVWKAPLAEVGVFVAGIWGALFVKAPGQKSE